MQSDLLTSEARPLKGTFGPLWNSITYELRALHHVRIVAFHAVFGI